MGLDRIELRKLWLLVLTLLTVISIALTIVHTINYQRYIEETTKGLLDRGFSHEFIKGYVDFDPWRTWGIGSLIIPLDIITGLLWIVSAIIVS